MSIPENHADAPTTLADRWADAEAKAVTSLIAPLSHVITARERRINLVADYLAAFKGQRQTGQKFCDIYGGIDRLARAGTLPLAGPLEADLRRVSAVEAANFIAEHKHDFPGDAETEFWLDEAVKLGRLCALRSRIDRAGQRLDAGHEDVESLLEEINAAGEVGNTADQGTISASDLVETFPHLRPYIIDGLLRQGETMNLIAAPKIGKSWMLLVMLLCIAAGLCWLGRQCQRGCVLLIDNELHPETLARRVVAVAAALGIDLAGIADTFQILSLRGKSENLATLDKFFRQIKPGQYSVIAIDALYRALPPGCEENSNEDMRDVYNRIDQISETTKAGIVTVHHSSKGLQSEKNITDVGSGAGAISRTVDVHCVIRAHEETDCAVMESRIRSGAQPEPMGLRWRYPVWIPDPTLDVERLATKSRRGSKKADTGDATGTPGYMAVVEHATEEPKPIGWFSARATGGKDHVARSLLRQACAVGAIHLWPGKKARDPERWATVPPGLE